LLWIQSTAKFSKPPPDFPKDYFYKCRTLPNFLSHCWIFQTSLKSRWSRATGSQRQTVLSPSSNLQSMRVLRDKAGFSQNVSQKFPKKFFCWWHHFFCVNDITSQS
jgi:hypothetical protein